MSIKLLSDEQYQRPENQNRDRAIIGYRSIENETKPLPIADVSSRFNLVWDADTNCENDFRSELLGKPIYDMKCNKCLSFVGAYHSPEDCEVKHCSNCGQEIKRS